LHGCERFALPGDAGLPDVTPLMQLHCQQQQQQQQQLATATLFMYVRTAPPTRLLHGAAAETFELLPVSAVSPSCSTIYQLNSFAVSPCLRRASILM
jgi:hypothetical protein